MQKIEMMEVPIGKVREVPGFNPRKELGDLSALVASVRKHGIIQPLVVRPTTNGHYGLLCGYRRYNAARKAGLKTLPVTVRDVKGIEALAIAVSENSADARTALSPLDEAEVFSRFRREGISCDRIGALCGCCGEKVRKALELLTAPKPILKKVRDGKLSKMAALALVSLNERVRKEGRASFREVDAHPVTRGGS